MINRPSTEQRRDPFQHDDPIHIDMFSHARPHARFGRPGRAASGTLIGPSGNIDAGTVVRRGRSRKTAPEVCPGAGGLSGIQLTVRSRSTAVADAAGDASAALRPDQYSAEGAVGQLARAGRTEIEHRSRTVLRWTSTDGDMRYDM